MIFTFSEYTGFTLHYLQTCITTNSCDLIAAKHKVKRKQYCLAVWPGYMNHICHMLLILSTLIPWWARSLIGDRGCQESSLVTYVGRCEYQDTFRCKASYICYHQNESAWNQICYFRDTKCLLSISCFKMHLPECTKLSINKHTLHTMIWQHGISHNFAINGNHSQLYDRSAMNVAHHLVC